jgi:hypothetical protein
LRFVNHKLAVSWILLQDSRVLFWGDQLFHDLKSWECVGVQHLMKRIQRGPVRGISLKLQEEERERRMDFVPEESAIKTDVIEVDRETIELLAALNMPQLPGVVQQAAPPPGGGFFKPQVGGFQGGNFQGNKTRT